MKDTRPSSLAKVLERCRTDPPNILRTLLAVQQAFGYVAPSAVPEIARTLGVTEADVAGVLSYYPELRTTQPGRHLVRICMGESCFANHCGRLLTAVRSYLGVDLGHTTPDWRFTLDRIHCLGNCGVGPTVIVDEDIYGRVVPADVPGLLNEYK
jgi:NADH:ubiquinone oxidoreductase subunit E